MNRDQMNRDQMLDFAKELLDSLNYLPVADDSNRQRLEGYTLAILTVVDNIHGKVRQIDVTEQPCNPIKE